MVYEDSEQKHVLKNDYLFDWYLYLNDLFVGHSNFHVFGHFFGNHNVLIYNIFDNLLDLDNLFDNLLDLNDIMSTCNRISI